eukprot:11173826-Lingulodinium_polyedra.AAC.1
MEGRDSRERAASTREKKRDETTTDRDRSQQRWTDRGAKHCVVAPCFSVLHAASRLVAGATTWPPMLKELWHA